MFGIGGSEILVILVIALLFLGPDKLPEAAKTISKGIRDLKKQSRVLQNQIEGDEQIGGAIRDLKSALRGEDSPVRPPVRKEPPKDLDALDAPKDDHANEPRDDGFVDEPQHAVTLPETAGEAGSTEQAEATELAALIKPASGTIPKSAPALAAPPPLPPPIPSIAKPKTALPPPTRPTPKPGGDEPN